MCALAAAVKKEFGTAVEEGGWPKPLDEIVEGENISKALATARTARTLAATRRERTGTRWSNRTRHRGARSAQRNTRSGECRARAAHFACAGIREEHRRMCAQALQLQKGRQFVRCGNDSQATNQEITKVHRSAAKTLTWKRWTCSYPQSSGKHGTKALVDRQATAHAHAMRASQTKHVQPTGKRSRKCHIAGRGK
ncbi:hypothetical protein ERJ75_000558800 [Trypanosoma vivax]|nr:hypothetical protein ERJ75_000558800 [Trypanosoma vivax]